MIKREYSSMAIVVYKNKVLYTIENIFGQERISLPKGHIEKGENIIQCAIRECKEETGVTLNTKEFVVKFAPYQYRFDLPNTKIKIIKKVYPYLFMIKDLKSIQISEKNILKADYLNIDELIDIATFDNVKSILIKTKRYLNI